MYGTYSPAIRSVLVSDCISHNSPQLFTGVHSSLPTSPNMAKRCRSDDLVKVNVGGCRFDIALQTANSFGYIRGRMNTDFVSDVGDDGYMFIDRDPSLFKILLQSVRNYARPPQPDTNACKQDLLAECAFFCVDEWLVETIKGEIGNFAMRFEDREIRFQERAGDAELLDPFGAATVGNKNAMELGPVLMLRDKPLITAKSAVDLSQRLNDLTNGLLAQLAPVDGLLLAGGCVVHALTAQPSSVATRCSDVDIFLRCALCDAMSKVKAVYEAVRKVGLLLSQNGSAKKVCVTRASRSVTFFLSDDTCPPIQVSARLFT